MWQHNQLMKRKHLLESQSQFRREAPRILEKLALGRREQPVSQELMSNQCLRIILADHSRRVEEINSTR